MQIGDYEIVHQTCDKPCDGKNLFTQTFSNNMREREEPKVKRSKLNHTEISYLPDYEKFGLEGLDDSHFRLIHKRVIDVAGCNPNIKVFFNDEEIKINVVTKCCTAINCAQLDGAS